MHAQASQFLFVMPVANLIYALKVYCPVLMFFQQFTYHLINTECLTATFKPSSCYNFIC